MTDNKQITPGSWWAKDFLGSDNNFPFIVEIDDRQRAWINGNWLRINELIFIGRVSKAIMVDVLRMRLSDNRTDYFVRIKCGERDVTPHVFRDERWKAEYEVAHYQWVFGLRENQPEFCDFTLQTHPND